MGMFDRFKEAIGMTGDLDASSNGHSRGDRSVKVSDVLYVTPQMEATWKKEAARNAMDAADLTRADVARRFGIDFVVPRLPGDRASRIEVLSESLMNQSYDRFSRHVDEVQRHYEMPDSEVARIFEIRGGVPTDPRGRADAISMGLMDRDASGRALDDHAEDQRAEHRLMGPDRSELGAQLAGEPDFLAARSEGDPADIENVERSFYASIPPHTIDDPSMREIAETIVDVAAKWGRGIGDIEHGPYAIGSERAVEIRALEASGRLTPAQRDDVLVDSYVDHVLATHPKAVAAWRHETSEIMQESRDFLHDRYGVVPPTNGDHTRDVARLEVSRLVGRVRYEDMVEAKGVQIVEPSRNGQAPADPVKDAAFAVALMSGLSL